MVAQIDSTSRLVADVGGTNTRLALYDPQKGELREVRYYLNRDYQRFEGTIAAWMEALQEPAPRDCCLAVAAPLFGDVVNMLNVDWSFSMASLAEQFRFSRLRCINDFEGNAYALPHLTAKDFATLRPGQSPGAASLATVGPGTGLGGSTLDRRASTPVARASEPGHMGLSPVTELELEIFRALLPRYGEIYAELLLSGPGLERLYTTLGEIRGETTEELAPDEISERALVGQCELSMLAVDTFCALLGSLSGDFVLANGAYGGLYLAGGIIPQILPLLRTSDFEQRFQNKEGMREQLQQIPLYVITTGHAGLIGAAHTPLPGV